MILWKLNQVINAKNNYNFYLKNYILTSQIKQIINFKQL